MKAIQATPLTIVVDTLDVVTPDDARAILAKFGPNTARGGYLDHVSPIELAGQLSAGLPFYPIGYAKQFDGDHLAARATALGLPHGVHLWLDDEGFEPVDAPSIISRLNAANTATTAAGYPGAGYFGSAQQLTSLEQTRLGIQRYWKGCSRVLDRFGQAAEPARGYCMWQGRPFNFWLNGKKYDASFVTADYEDDLPMFCGP